ncbi:MAG: hypothetical protein GWN84_26065, partial [Gammaproteobacteria bacterium]|nr:hypothetical protein [Gammaproteobacteria bacterium]NIR82547.1 hypothetical protein [Gammaproteobacteria bacterium]NIU04052.1 hypothetical protein [Gammaproteobacteria bacterium]NIX85326.1 hypothetical protein [Gammaproteobacteria bacterium]
SGKHTRLRFLHRAFPDAARYICTDDYAEVGHVGPPWEFYLPQDFVAAWPEIRVAATAVACPLCERRPVMPVH